jgi:hypothetical protein
LLDDRRDANPHLHHRALIRLLCVLGALLVAGSASAHQDTVARSRMVIRENGDVEYALKIPVEDLAEVLGRQGHAALNAPEVHGATELLFRHFLPLVSVASTGGPCPVERRGLDVPEDERLHGELRFAFHCPAGAPVTLDYRVFFDIDPGHVGVLEVESPGGKARAELIRERPRWEIDATAAGPPAVRFVENAAVPPAERRRPAAPSAAPPRKADQPPAGDPPRPSEVEELPSAPRDPGRTWMIVVFIFVVALGALQAIRMARRRPAPPSR